MGYMLIADADKMAERSAPCGTVPMFPVFNDKHVLSGFTPGTVLPGEEFEFHGDPEWPPRWCTPLDDEGRAAYLEMEVRLNDKRQLQRKALRAQLTVLDEELARDEVENPPTVPDKVDAGDGT